MAKDKTLTTVSIFGVEYTVSSDRDPKEVQRIAKYVNDKMWEISENNKLITSEKIAVLAALTIAEEFMELHDHRKKEASQLQTQTRNIIKMLDGSEK
ncbi:MAG: cell division protein ZapA [bacterium]|nr:cell division protein ZapA [bacterium]